jgi:hypothetical protein
MEYLICKFVALLSYAISFLLAKSPNLLQLTLLVPTVTTPSQAYEVFGILSSLLTAFLGLFAIFLIFKANSLRSEKENIYNIYVAEIPRNELFLNVINLVYGLVPNAKIEYDIYKRMLIRMEVSGRNAQFYSNRIAEQSLNLIRNDLNGEIKNITESISVLRNQFITIKDLGINRVYILDLVVYIEKYGISLKGLDKNSLFDLSSILVGDYQNPLEQTYNTLLGLLEFRNITNNQELSYVNYRAYSMRFESIPYWLNYLEGIDTNLVELRNAIGSRPYNNVFPEIDDPEEERIVSKTYNIVKGIINKVKDIEKGRISRITKNTRSIVTSYNNFDSSYQKFLHNAYRLREICIYENKRIRYFTLPFLSLVIPTLLSFFMVLYTESLYGLGIINPIAWVVILLSIIFLLYPLYIIIKFITD